MDEKLSISDAHPDFEIYQECGNQSTIFLKLTDFAKSCGNFDATNGHLTLAIPHETFKEIVKSWEENKHRCNTEFLDLVNCIKKTLSDLKEPE